MEAPKTVFQLAANIQLLLMDVDGVLTDGKLYNVPGSTGDMVETKAFDSQDGIALQWLHWKGIHTGIISGRVSPAVVTRCKQCHVQYVYQGHIEKVPLYEKILTASGLAPEQIAYVGDDLTDLVVMRRVGLAIAPANARPDVKRYAHFVTASVGGRGAIREVCELLLQAHGHWEEILRKYEAHG
jgi:3-deoxy-D-manno-octulosonate 8-phosphate phosphatase (KDO 8-P phosphatase)